MFGLALHRILLQSSKMKPGRLVAYASKKQASKEKKISSVPAPTVPGKGSLYDRPDLYSIAFGYRAIDGEAKFLAEVAAPASDGAPRRFLELGCGPAHHCTAMANLGFLSLGIDLSPTMVEFASKLNEAHKDSVEIRQGDMRHAVVTEEEYNSFACAGVLLGSFSHMLTNRDALDVFHNVYKALAPGGAFVLELPHVGDLFDGSLMDPEAQSESWEREEGAVKIAVRWGKEGDDYDYERQIYDRTVDVKVYETGAAFGANKAKLVTSWREVVQQRVFTAQEIDLLATMTGFRVEGVYGDFNKQLGLRHEEAYRSIFVLRKVGAHTGAQYAAFA